MKPMKIVVRVPNWLGDCVMALPVFAALRKHYPHARICAAVRPHLADCFSACPEIAQTFLVPGSKDGIRALWKNGVELREEQFDIGILLTNSFSTALWLYLSKARRRIGFARDLRSLFLTSRIQPSEGILAAHQAEYYLHTLSPLGINTQLSDPVLTVPQRGIDEAHAALQTHAISGNYTVIAPFSAFGPVKDWPLERYLQTAQAIHEKTGMAVLLTGTGPQKDRLADAMKGYPALHNMAGTTGLCGFMGLIEGCDLFVGGDSGGAHVAAALSKPTISIFGITEPSRTRALGPRVAVVGNGGMSTPNLKDPVIARQARLALEAITIEDILIEAEKFLVESEHTEYAKQTV